MEIIVTIKENEWISHSTGWMNAVQRHVASSNTLSGRFDTFSAPAFIFLSGGHSFFLLLYWLLIHNSVVAAVCTLAGLIALRRKSLARH
jgi:hypothetical protein